MRYASADMGNFRFDTRFQSLLPGDPSASASRRQVAGALWSSVVPQVVAAPSLIAWSPAVAELLGLDAEFVRSPVFLGAVSGNALLPGMTPYATNYGGHQFGQWAGQLGDGRAINLGEVRNDRGQHWTLQLKGAGPTPYSRTADGLAVLRSSLREYACSEAMAALGVPTTRALSLVLTGEEVLRDMFYDGHAKLEPGAIVCRVARSFLRFGHFELPASRGDVALLRTLADYVIRADFGHLGEPSKAVYEAWFTEVCERTLALMVHWMRVGFVHGVMNTDNMSILGDTIDYGPYGWLEGYDPLWTPNTTDAGGRRYAFGRQPQIALWNLARLASAILPLTDDREPLEAALTAFADGYEPAWLAMTLARLGLRAEGPDTDRKLIESMYELLGSAEIDFVIWHRHLARVELDTLGEDASSAQVPEPLREACYDENAIDAAWRERLGAWLLAYRARVRSDPLPDAERRARMDALNPKFVLRNYQAQMAIDAVEQGDTSRLERLMAVLRRPYAEQPEAEEFAARRPEWARHRAGCSMLSCSS